MKFIKVKDISGNEVILNTATINRIQKNFTFRKKKTTETTYQIISGSVATFTIIDYKTYMKLLDVLQVEEII
ncbi:hypothetical protein BN85406160 [Alteracholeplasma palmae J233]|uniref:Uncharacterized protein n=1 Tax=Alteracholeplasma palmae (strain ATCC 49389 / J233) TaxID=1318466 RepID=U4KKP0_ALTPJ|nr:hypothetical protein [Alteracholeplasma palmae]CCV64193.1 hypothetical protein BN85406160 [Alteracholeplasma palmae J233]